MNKDMERRFDERGRKERLQVLVAVYGGLSDAVARSGGELTGFTVKIDEYECLLVLKALFPGGPQVAFVGGSDLAACLIKGVVEGNRDMLRWRSDKWAS